MYSGRFPQIAIRAMRLALLVLLFIAVAPSSLMGAEKFDRRTIKAETPQALLAIYDRAMAQKDWRLCFLCYDPKMRGEYLREILIHKYMSKDAKLGAIVNKWLKIDPARPESTFPNVREDDRVPDGVLIYEALQKRTDDLAGFVDEVCRYDGMGHGLFQPLGEVGEIKIQGDMAVGYRTRPPVKPIGPALSHPAEKSMEPGQSAVPPRSLPSGEHAGLPGNEPGLREPVYFRRIDGNWYFTYPEPPPPLSPAERAKQLRAEVQSLWVLICCSGGMNPGALARESYIELRLSVRPFVYTSDNSKIRLVRLTESQAKRFIDHLAADGFLRQSIEPGKQKVPRPDMSQNRYTIQVSTEKLQLHEDLGWGPAMVKRLEGLRTALEGDGAKAMDALLTKLAEDRKTWEKNRDSPRRVPATLR